MIQKKYLYGLLMSVACLSACNNGVETIDENAADNIRLSFGVAGIEESVETRGSIITGTVGTTPLDPTKYYFTGQLKVYAVADEGNSAVAPYTDVNKVFNVSTSTKGYHNTLVKWPNDGLRFYAFAPVTTNYTSDFPTSITNPTATPYTTYTTNSYTTPAEYKDQKDLLFARTTTERTLADGDVPLTFNHILSRITFQVRQPAANEGGEFINNEVITLKSISIKNVKATSTGSFGSGVTASSGYSWGTLSGTGSYTMTFPANTVVSSAAFGTTYLSVGSDGDSMFMLPHENINFVNTNPTGGITPASDSYLEIVYNVSTEGASDRTRQFRLKAMENEGHKWEMGEWTNYQFTIKANYITLNPITVAGWGNPSNIPVTVQ